MAIYWSELALSAFTRIGERVEMTAGEAAAQRWRQRVSDRLELAALLPYASRVVPEFNVPTYREVFEDAYRIHYRVVGNDIEVVALFHGAMHLGE
ncbi:MAG: type II toxin-antitoxin system RelE/ParE family toxin [Dehalococcoidia bacterium]|nr:type II toxin-antitoxin system RelE/ParE family toxin [Dehalococcoidia bacterium]